MTKIILVRHGDVAWIGEARFRGRAPLPLSELGERQIRATARRIAATWRVTAVYSSPMKRCLDTADAIAAPFGLMARVLDGLNDVDYGDWQGLTLDEASGRWPEEIGLWLRTPHLAAVPRGESLAGAFARVSTALSTVVRRHADDTIVLVGHDSVNRLILLSALDLPLSRYWHLKQDPCAVSELDFASGAFMVRTMNETHHLEKA